MSRLQAVLSQSGYFRAAMEQLWAAELEAEAATSGQPLIPQSRGLTASFGHGKPPLPLSLSQDAVATLVGGSDAGCKVPTALGAAGAKALGSSIGHSHGAATGQPPFNPQPQHAPGPPPLDLMHFVVELDPEEEGTDRDGAVGEEGSDKGRAHPEAKAASAESTESPLGAVPAAGPLGGGGLGGLASAAARLQAGAAPLVTGQPNASSSNATTATATHVPATAPKPQQSGTAKPPLPGLAGLAMGASFSALRTGASAPGRAVTGEAVAALIRFLYGEAPVMTTDNVPALLAAASYLDVPQLAVRAADFVFSHLTVENGESQTWRVAMRFGLQLPRHSTDMFLPVPSQPGFFDSAHFLSGPSPLAQ